LPSGARLLGVNHDSPIVASMGAAFMAIDRDQFAELGAMAATVMGFFAVLAAVWFL
jgi:hypothetical protein